MELHYKFNKDYSMENVVFDGLNGREYITSTKDALNLMKIKNPALAFCEEAKAGLYDSISDEEYQQALDTIQCVKSLWRYPGEAEGTSRTEMNILMLLANAIELVSRQNAELRQYRESSS